MKGAFITLEGIDGSGKSTLAEGLYKKLSAKGYDVVLTKAPGGTPAGALIRELILHGKLSDLKAELFLFLADRADHVTSVIKPALADGKIVICDRFSDSTVAYQVTRGLEPSKVRSMCEYATSGLEPDLTLYVDIPPHLAFERLEKNRSHKDRIENEGLNLLSRIDQAYKDMLKAYSRMLAVDGRLSVSELLETSFVHVTRFIERRS